MSEAERLLKVAARLQKTVDAQAEEIKRLKSLLGTARIARIEYEVVDDVLRITATCIGVDEQAFVRSLKPGLEGIANALAGQVNALRISDKSIRDTVTGKRAGPTASKEQRMGRAVTAPTGGLKQ